MGIGRGGGGGRELRDVGSIKGEVGGLSGLGFRLNASSVPQILVLPTVMPRNAKKLYEPCWEILSLLRI